MDLTKLHLHWGTCRRGKKEYKSYTLARAYRENGKNRKELVIKLGSLSETEVQQWRAVLQMLKNPTTNIHSDFKNLITIYNHSYLDIAVILETWNRWEFNIIFDLKNNKRKHVLLSSIATILTINRCIDPASKSKVCSWIKKTTLPLMLNISLDEINPSRIYRELPLIESCKDKLSQHICQKILQNDPKSLQSVFYDLSSTTFTRTKCILTKWGHCKEGYEYHIVLALIVNSKGMPIYWEVLHGNTADATTISWLLNRLKEKVSVAISIPTMIFDRGMVSEDNLLLLEEEKIKYITALDKNQIESTTKFDFSEFKKMNIENVEKTVKKASDFIEIDKNTYCKEFGIIKNRRYILCFNPQLFKDQKKARDEKILRLQNFIQNINKELLQAKKNRNKKSTQEKFDDYLCKEKINSFVKIELEKKLIPKQTKTTEKIISYQGKIIIDEHKKIEAGKLDGFWLLVTNLLEKEKNIFVYDFNIIVNSYREKVIIESSFRDIKSFIEIAPVHVWKEYHVKAHYTICVLAHLIDRTLSLKLHERSGKESKEIISHEKLYEELNKCQLNHHKIEGINKNIHNLTQPTVIQMDLLQRLQMSYLVKEDRIKNLISN